MIAKDRPIRQRLAEDAKLNELVFKRDAELRCSAPESGRITSIMTVTDLDGSQQIVRVGVDLKALRKGPEPPPYGTDREPLRAS